MPVRLYYSGNVYRVSYDMRVRRCRAEQVVKFHRRGDDLPVTARTEHRGETPGHLRTRNTLIKQQITVYRVSYDMRGKPSELFQTGVELIGSSSLRSDLEMVELAAAGRPV